MATTATKQQQSQAATATGTTASTHSLNRTSKLHTNLSAPSSPLATNNPLICVGSGAQQLSIVGGPKFESDSSGGRNSICDRFASFVNDNDDIESIAKQISDHAEAIYQTWKARGLAPSEILNCEAFDRTLTTTSGAITDTSTSQFIEFDQKSSFERDDDLTNRNDNKQIDNNLVKSDDTHYNVDKDDDESDVNDDHDADNRRRRSMAANMSNSNLKKLVSTFVNEDKARQQQQQQSTATTPVRKANILTSGTIKDALKKFESADCNVALLKPNYLKYNSGTATNKTTSSESTPTKNVVVGGATIAQSSVKELSPNRTINSTPLEQSQQQLQPQQQNQLNNSNYENKLCKNVPDVLINSLEQEKRTTSKSSTSSPILSPTTTTTTITANGSANDKPTVTRSKPETPAKPANLINHQPIYPFKVRSKAIENGTNGKANSEIVAPKTSPISGEGKSIESTTTTATAAKSVKKSSPEKTKNAVKSTTTKNDVKTGKKQTKSNHLLDEVLLEEERLINALKTGTVISNDKLPEVITSTLTQTKTNGNSCDSATKNKSWTKATSASTTTTGSTTTTMTVPSKMNGEDSNAISNDNNTTNSNETDGVQLKLTKVRPKNDAAVPHPDVNLHTNKTGQASGGRVPTTGSAVRPFLTRGSVAERVLMFEKCPEIKALRTPQKDPSKLVTKPQAKPPCTTLQRTVRGSKSVYIPRFHFPYGKPLPSIGVESTLQRLQAAFNAFPNKAVAKEEFLVILKICALPFYWRMPLFHCTQLTSTGLVDGKRFCEFWKQMSVYCHDTVSRFVFILSHGQRSRPYILPEDLVSLVQDVVDTHPGLAFLKEAQEFHSRYVHTVIARIFYSVNRTWSGKITMPELRRSDLLQVIQLLEEEEDINQIMAHFSYEHFYVIYCKFWELDRDHDLFIDQYDLARHNDHALSSRIIERIFSGCVTKTNKTNQKMSYTEFVWFLLSEEDKSHPTAVEYWFRCMDLDGDGVLSMYELEYFYEEQQHRMESIGIETLPFEDCLCQMFDMIKPSTPGCITLSDLKRCKMTPIFFDTFFNLEKYLEHEQRDPFANQRDQEEMTDWDRYAAQEYELLVAEEGGDTHGSYDDEEDYESNIDILESHMDEQMTCGINDI